ncbi:hypothetical protein SSX86_010152 [Deinandra increscens subsp. villosa]|uniref:Cystatin domain-containing protein n=1 Tax=Deinandra increscens subsp. villosa TaxID=3103831 RepID=A0AAP0DEQ8_9ASTR
MNHPSKMHNNLFTTIILILFLFSKPSAAFGGGAITGGWKRIHNMTDPTVVKIGKFAIHEHNKRDHASLKFRKVVKGESQVVAGMNYNLTIRAAERGADKCYVALVWDKPWKKFRRLVSFKGPV